MATSGRGKIDDMGIDVKYIEDGNRRQIEVSGRLTIRYSTGFVEEFFLKGIMEKVLFERKFKGNQNVNASFVYVSPSCSSFLACFCYLINGNMVEC